MKAKPSFKVPELQRLLALGDAAVEDALSRFFATWRCHKGHSRHLLGALKQRGLAGLAEEVLWSMWRWRLEVRVFECTAAISAHGATWTSAVQLLSKMTSLCRPNMACPRLSSRPRGLKASKPQRKLSELF